MDSQAIAGVCLQPGGGAGTEIGTPPLDAAFWSNPNVVVTPCRGTSQQTRSKGLAYTCNLGEGDICGRITGVQ